jgi:hypothetical protein
LRSLAGASTNSGTILLGPVVRINADSNSTLVLAGPVQNAGSTNMAGSALAVGGFGDVLMTNSLFGGLFGAGSLTKDGYGTLTLMGGNAYNGISMGSMAVNSGVLKLDFSGVGAIGSNVAIPTMTMSLGGIGMGTTTGGVLNIVGPASGVLTQQFASFAVNPGNNALVASNSGGGMVVNLNGIARAVGSGIVNFSNDVGSILTTTTTNNLTGILGPWAIYGGTDWAAITNPVAERTVNYKLTNFSGYVNFAGAGTITDGSNQNLRLASGGGVSYALNTLTTTVNTILANDGAGGAVITNMGRTLRLGGSLNSGGIFLPAASGGLTVGNSANDGYLTAGTTNNGAGEMVLINHSANALTINSSIISNGSGAVTVTVNGPGTVNFGVSNAFNALYINSGNVTLSGTNIVYGVNPVTIRGGTVTFASGSTNFFSGTNGNVSVESGVVNLNGALMAGGYGGTPVSSNSFLVASATSGRAVLNLAGSLASAGMIQAGVGANSAGAIYQTGGALVPRAAGSSTTFGLGVAAGSYGYYQMSGGTWGGTNSAQFDLASGTGAVGVFDMLGGTVIKPAEWVIFNLGNAPGQVAVMNLFGGTFSGAAGANGIRLNYLGDTSSAQGGYALLNVAGPGMTVLSTNGPIELQLRTTAATSIVNALSGTKIVTTAIRATQQTGQSVLNMDGGVLHAFSSGTFMTGLTAAIIYKNGVTLDTSNNTVTVAQNLAGATGYGLLNIAVTNGGAGYIGAPAVVIGGAPM